MYDPTIGQFLSDDPIGVKGGDSNFRRYVGNGPTNATDPSGLSAVGHHWLPIQIILEFRTTMTSAAFEVALGAYSGKTDPNHCFDEYGRVKHRRYNNLARENLEAYMKANNIKKLTQMQISDFISKLQNGLNFEGKVDKEIQAFNNAIRSSVKDGASLAKGLSGDEILKLYRAQGKSILSSGRILGLTIGALMSGWASDLLGETVGALGVASESRYFQNGMQSLSDGDLAAAEGQFLGNGLNSFTGDLLVRKFDKAAANFAKYYTEAVERARLRAEEVAVPVSDYTEDP
jgi:uncharacterized protein RhaS with RHS repeats